MDGSSVAAMEARSGARIRLSRPLPGPDHRVALVSGLFPQVMDAAELILEKILCQSDQAIGAPATVVLVVPDACCDALIGKGGAVLKSLAEASNAGITISPYDICNGLHDRLVTITGHLDNQLQAIFLILSELLDNVHYSCSSAGDNFSSFLASPVGCEDGGPDEHTGRYHSRPITPMRSPDNSKDAQESFSIAVFDEHVDADTEVTGASIGTMANVDLIATSANVDLIAGSHAGWTEAKDVKKLGPYYLHLVDKFIEAIAPEVKAKSLYDHLDHQIAYNQQTIEYAESALKHYNRKANKMAGYELVEGICSCGIKEPEGLYGHVNFTAKNNLDSKVEFFFVELFWDSEEEIFNTTDHWKKMTELVGAMARRLVIIVMGPMYVLILSTAMLVVQI